MKLSDYSQVKDEELVAIIVKNKDTALFQILYDRYASKIYRKCISFTSSEAEAQDLTHDILLKIYLRLSSFKQKSKFSTWIYAVTYNFCVDHKRKVDKQLRNYADYAEEENFSPAPDTDEELYQMKVEQLKALLDQIDPEEKALLLMVYQDDLPIKSAVMEITKLTEGAIKMRLKRSKQKIVKMSKSPITK